jgi:DNA repair protein SbcC/Rad50
MRIKSLRLINFKNFYDETTFDFQDHNLILGKNGVGKSTIKDAILFCFYNRTAEGSLSESTRHISNGKMKSLVEIEFEKNNQSHIIRRERTNKQTRITYRDSSQSEEDSQITQETLESMIPSYQDFSAVFNIGWFMSLNDREKRDYMLKLTPSVNRSHLFEKMGGITEDIEKFSLLFDNLDKTHKNLLSKRLENEKLAETMGIFNEESVPIEIPTQEFKDISKELNELRNKKESAIHNAYAIKEYERIKKINEESEIKNKELEKRISEIKILELEMPSQDKINSLISKKNEYSKQINLPSGTCPTCLQNVRPQHRNKIEKINLTNKEKLDKTEKLLLEEQRAYGQILEKWKENEENKKKKLMLETQFADPLPLPEKPHEENIVDNFGALETEQKKYLERENTIKVLTEQEEIRKKKIESNEENMALLSQENDRLKFLISIFSPKGIPAEEMSIKLEPLKVKFKELLPDSDIITLEPLKNEMGFKEVFRITLLGKDYSKLSMGEKTRIDISLSQIINSMMQEKIDVFFLDNSEVLDSSISLPHQSFICKVTNQPLKIN